MFGWLDLLTGCHGTLSTLSADSFNHDNQHLQEEEKEEGEVNGLFAS